MGPCFRRDDVVDHDDLKQLWPRPSRRRFAPPQDEEPDLRVVEPHGEERASVSPDDAMASPGEP